MENDLENLNFEPSEPYQVSEPIRIEVADYLKRVADPELTQEEYKILNTAFRKKAEQNPEIRLEYLRQATKHQADDILTEIHNLERLLRDRDRKAKK